MTHRQHAIRLKSFRQSSSHDQPILQHIGNAARGADVVLQDQILARLGIADQVYAADVGVDSVRHL